MASNYSIIFCSLVLNNEAFKGGREILKYILLWNNLNVKNLPSKKSQSASRKANVSRRALRHFILTNTDTFGREEESQLMLLSEATLGYKAGGQRSPGYHQPSDWLVNINALPLFTASCGEYITLFHTRNKILHYKIYQRGLIINNIILTRAHAYSLLARDFDIHFDDDRHILCLRVEIWFVVYKYMLIKGNVMC